ncbi:uncharacterized protein LOC125085509 isoform X3 [Lutra lutra]|uniref:uncharacterized protein LOC125085509 isoform X3 n=1 Tax=Lutra lutra TaxID=9657 RepID=UPI001FD249F7|nr:uncharacterized protein LOC125085509 isoform X3 [Lutra lutra]
MQAGQVARSLTQVVFPPSCISARLRKTLGPSAVRTQAVTTLDLWPSMGLSPNQRESLRGTLWKAQDTLFSSSYNEQPISHTILVLLIQMMEQKLREVKEHVHSHTARRGSGFEARPVCCPVKGHRDTRQAQESVWRGGILTDSVFQVLTKKRGPSEPQAHTTASELLRLRESQRRRLDPAD